MPVAQRRADPGKHASGRERPGIGWSALDAVNTHYVLGDIRHHTHVLGRSAQILARTIGAIERIEELAEAMEQASSVCTAERPRDREHRLTTSAGQIQRRPLVRHASCETHSVAKPILRARVRFHPAATNHRTEGVIVQRDEDPGPS